VLAPRSRKLTKLVVIILVYFFKLDGFFFSLSDFEFHFVALKLY